MLSHISTIHFRSTKLQNLAHGLSPSYLRLGGTTADALIFQSGSSHPSHGGEGKPVEFKSHPIFNMTSMWAVFWVPPCHLCREIWNIYFLLSRGKVGCYSECFKVSEHTWHFINTYAHSSSCSYSPRWKEITPGSHAKYEVTWARLASLYRTSASTIDETRNEESEPA